MIRNPVESKIFGHQNETNERDVVVSGAKPWFLNNCDSRIRVEQLLQKVCSR